MSLYLRLAWRNVWRHRRRTLIVVLAIGFTTALMLFYDGMLDGFDQAIYGNAVKVLGGNIQVHGAGYGAEPVEYPMLAVPDPARVIAAATARPQVVAATRRINTGGMASNREGAFGTTIVGIDPEAEASISLVARNVAEGRFLRDDDTDVALIGRGLAVAMDVGVGDRFTLVGRGAHNQMRQRTMTVIGIYDVGVSDIEKRTLYISLAEAQDLYMAAGEVTDVVLWLKSLGQENAVMAVIRSELAGYEVETWGDRFPELQNTMATKGAVMQVFGIIMLFIAGIGMLNLLLMAVYERTREIGLLGALGFKPRQISRLFLLEGAITGIVGSLAGTALGLLVNLIMSRVGFDFSAFTDMADYMALIDGRIYCGLGLSAVPRLVITAVIVSILAATYPAIEASRREPAAALHYV